MNSKSLARLAIAGSILIVLGVGVGPFLLKWNAKQRVFENERKTLKKWASQKFVPVSNQEDLHRVFTKSIEKTPSAISMSVQQRQRLLTSMVSFCKAFSTGNFDAYADFRFPNGGSQMELDPLLGNALLSALQDESFSIPPFKLTKPKAGASFSTNSAFEIARAFWEHRVTQLFNPATHSPAYCFNALRGVADESVEVQFNTTAGMPASISSMCNSDNSSGFFRKPPCFRVLPTPDEIVERKMTLSTARVRMLIETSLPVKAFPVFVHYYWDSGTSNWVAYEFIVGIANNEDIEFLF